MHICHIRVTYLRNFRYLDVALGPKLVVVGENNVGKSNLLFALRLILDPTLQTPLDTFERTTSGTDWQIRSRHTKSSMSALS